MLFVETFCLKELIRYQHTTTIVFQTILPKSNEEYNIIAIKSEVTMINCLYEALLRKNLKKGVSN